MLIYSGPQAAWVNAQAQKRRQAQSETDELENLQLELLRAEVANAKSQNMGDAAGGGWTVADTAAISTRSPNSDGGGGGAAATGIHSPRQHQQHVRWSNDIPTDDEVDRNRQETSTATTTVQKPKSKSEEDLDRLLEGLVELTETLPGKPSMAVILN